MHELSRRRFVPATVLVTTALALSLVAGCRVNLNDDLEKILGSMNSALMEASYSTDRDPLINGFVSRLGESLVRVSDRSQLHYRFSVLETEEVNAVAVPYGHVYVYKGLLDMVDTEDELAAVLGHEVTHVVKRHSLKAFKDSLFFGLILNSFKNDKYDTPKTVLAIGNTFRELHYSRKQEYEADYVGAHTAIKADFDPAAAASFFRKLKERYEKGHVSRLEAIFATHPPTADRISRMEHLDWMQTNDPHYLTTMIDVGRGYAARFQFRAAEQKFRAALRADSNSVDAHLGLAEALAGRGRPNDARQEYQWVVHHDPTNSAAKQQLDRLGTGSQRATAAPLSNATREALLTMLPRLQDAVNESSAVQADIEKNSAARMSSANDAAAANDEARTQVAQLLQAIGERDDSQRESLLSMLDQSGALTQKAINDIEAVADESLDTTTTFAATAQDLTKAIGGVTDEPTGRGLLEAAQNLVTASRQSMEDVSAAADANDDALRSANRASRANVQTARYLWDTRQQSLSDFALHTSWGAEVDARHALDMGKEAADRGRRARRLAVRSRVRAVVIEADSLVTSTRNISSAAVNGMLAHYFLSDVPTVDRLRIEQKLPLPDVIMAMCEAKQTAKAGNHQPAAWTSLSWTSAIDSYNAEQLDNISILTKFFINALKYELGYGASDSGK